MVKGCELTPPPCPMVKNINVKYFLGIWRLYKKLKCPGHCGKKVIIGSILVVVDIFYRGKEMFLEDCSGAL